MIRSVHSIVLKIRVRKPCISSGFFPTSNTPMCILRTSYYIHIFYIARQSEGRPCHLTVTGEFAYISYNTRSTIVMPSSSNRSRRGSHISLVYGTSTPGEERVPSRTICVAMPQGMPTVRAIAECPSGAPYASSVDVMICCPQFSECFRFVHMKASRESIPITRARTSVPSTRSTTNLCCSMTRSRSPGTYVMSVSRRAQSVSSRLLPRGTSGS